MSNLLVYPLRGIKIRIKNFFLNLEENPECFVISPGGCGSVTLIKYLDKFTKSNLYFEKKYKGIRLGHNFNPPPIFKKKKIKIILLVRNKSEIYTSMLRRGFIRNSLSLYGDLFPFLYVNILKDEKKLKKKFINYLTFFYDNWSNYNKNFILKISYKDLYNKKTKYRIKKFLGIKNKKFITNFPKYKKYINNNSFVDPSTALFKEINK